MKYRCIVADPPWPFKDRLPGNGRGAGKNYSLMKMEEIHQIINQFTIDDNALLFLWRVASMPEEALSTVRAWGFVPKSEIIWDKQTKTGKDWFGMGRIVRSSHETCIVASKGKPEILSRSIRSRFTAPVGRHSEKPQAFFDLVESLCPGPRLELFARVRRTGWDAFGDELVA